MGSAARRETAEGTADHDALPLEDTLYTAVGGLPASLNRADDYPVEALCSQCHQPIRAERPQDPWLHTSRQPGDPR